MPMHDLIPVFPDRDHTYVREIVKKALACPVCGASNAKLNGMTVARLANDASIFAYWPVKVQVLLLQAGAHQTVPLVIPLAVRMALAAAVQL